MPLINGADRGLRWFIEDVWGQFGADAGYLDNLDGVDLAPPDSLLMTHAATTGRP